MRTWNTFIKRNSWSDLTNKPTILADNQVHWNEIVGIPERVAFLASNIPGNWQPWVLSDFYSQRVEWLPLTAAPNAWTMVQRDGNGKIIASNFSASALPSVSTGLSVGTFYRDVNGFVKVAI